MNYFFFLFLFRRRAVIVIIAAASVLVVSGVIIGLVFGLRKCKNKSDLLSVTGVRVLFSFEEYL